MDEQAILYFVVGVFGLVAALILSTMLVAWLKLRRMRFAPSLLQTVDRAGMPHDVAAILDPIAERLVALGFVHEETLLVHPVLQGGDPQPTWLDVHFHAASGSRASVQMAEAPEPGLLAAVTFSTDYAASILVSENRRQHLLFPMPAHYKIDDAMTTTLAEHWAFHGRRVASAGATQGAVVSDREIVRQRHLALRASLFDYWRQSRTMQAIGKEWRFTASGAWRYLRHVMAGTRRLAKLPPHAEIETPSLRVLADVYAWRRQESIDQHNLMSRRGKLLWFSISALAGAAAFGAMTSWDMVPAILGVLLFHEFGHALAMRAVGYQRLSVLVLPFLGAVAIGRKDDASPWQKLVVLLAGPLPGLIVAVICLRLGMGDGEHHTALMSVGALALTINLFNLLPFTPLDGGQIVDTFLFSHRPRLRFAFFVLSIAALIGVALALESTPLLVGGFLLALSMRGAWRRMRLLGGLPSIAPEDDPVSVVFNRIHATPAARWPSYAQRLQSVRALLPWVRGRAPHRFESAVGIALYLATMVLPIALLWDTGVPQQALATLNATVTANVRPSPPPDWTQKLAQADTPEARWQVLWEAGQWFDEAEDEMQALAYYQKALTEATQMPDNPPSQLHRLDARLAVSRLSESDVALAASLDLLPTLRELPAGERWRLADVLEALNWRDGQATPETRIERYREAIAVRETAPSEAIYSLYEDRVQLARLLDAHDDSAGAEALLRKNLDAREALDADSRQTSIWQIEPVIWFFIAHNRAAEAEALFAAQPMPKYNSETLRSTLAWTHLAQGKMASARKILEEALPVKGKQSWQQTQRMMLLLDLIHASADAPDEDARWLKEATDTKAALGPKYRGSIYLRDTGNERNTWESMRNRARLEAYKRLPGASEELDESDRNTCKRAE